jgi:hypothetical protein
LARHARDDCAVAGEGVSGCFGAGVHGVKMRCAEALGEYTGRQLTAKRAARKDSCIPAPDSELAWSSWRIWRFPELLLNGSIATEPIARPLTFPEIQMSTLLSALLLFAALVAPATHVTENPASEAFRLTARGHSKAMLAAATLMPADKYGYRPTPAQRSFGETIAHIVSDSHITCSAIAGVSAGPEEKLAGSDAKEKLVSALQSTLAFCRGALAGVTDAKLDDSVI